MLQKTEMKEYIDRVLAPLLEGDGGYIAYENEDENGVTVLIRGECSCCNKLTRCLSWCEEKIKLDTGRQVKLIPHISKPYFRDT